MEAAIAIISAILGLFLYNSFKRAKVMKNNDEASKTDAKLEDKVDTIETDINKEKANQDYIKEKNERETKDDVATDILTDFFNDRDKQ